jgi:putative spermidine/putrescine transport system permease protein
MSGRARSRAASALLLAPAAAALVLFFVVPLVQILIRSFTDPTVSFQNYATLFTDGSTLRVLGRTLTIGLIVAIATLLLAYPYTYVMCHTTPVIRAIMFTIVLIPFWTSMLARNYAWYILMQRGGVIHKFFDMIGIPDVVLLRTSTGVAIVMVGVLLPFMVLPLYSVLSQIDPRLLSASQSLGATRRATFLQIYSPLSKPGIISGVALVFILALGFYITPALLGAPQDALIAQLIAIRTQKLLDFGGAGAMGILLLAVTALVLLLGQKLSGRGARALVAAGRTD